MKTKADEASEAARTLAKKRWDNATEEDRERQAEIMNRAREIKLQRRRAARDL